MNFVLEKIAQGSNYGVINYNNVYNCFIDMMHVSGKEENKQFIEMIKKNIGMSFYHSFKEYFIYKFIGSDLLEFFK